MIEELGHQLIANGFLPHGYCLSWSPPLVGTYIVSDALIALSYFSMPVAMAYFAWRRPNFPYKWLLWMFVAFILSCGTTHLMGTIILWQPLYWIDAILKAITAVVSAATAIVLWPMIPKALSIPSHEEMQAINEELLREIAERKRMEEALRRANEELEKLHRITDASLTKALHRLDAHMGNSPLAIVEFDPDFRVIRWSEAAEQLFGWRPYEIVGKAIADFHWVHEDDMEKLSKTWNTMLSGTSPRNKNINRNYRKDGAIVHCEWYNSALYDDQGRLVSILSQVLDVTEREKNAEQLRASEEKYRTLFSNMTEGFGLGETVFDKDGTPVSGHFLELNEAFYEQTGIPRGVLGRPVREYLPQLEWSWIERCSAVALSGKAQRFDSFNADTQRHYDVYVFCPTPGRFAMLLRDITEQKRMAKALEESETRFRATFEQAAVGMAHVAQDGHWLQVNDRLCQIVGFDRENLLGLTFQDITYPPDLSADLAQAQQLLAGTIQSYSMEKRYVRRDGTLVWINLTASLVRTATGEPDYFISVVEDIQARKGMEVALRESQERLQLFIRFAPAALAMFDSEMRYLASSRRWMEDFHLDENIIGRSHYDVVPDIPERWKEIHQRGLSGMVIRADEDRFERADGTVQWKRWEVRPWRTGDGIVGGIVIFTEDITRFKEAQEEIHRLNADLERRVEERTAELTAANQELDSFAYAVSHDLRAPLRAINGFGQILEETYASQLDGEAFRYLQQIRLASRKMSDLIDGILTLSRVTRSELRRDRIDLSAMAEWLLAGLAAAEPGRAVAWQVEPDLIARGDARMVESVMTNLLDNAWKYTAKTPNAVIRVYRDGNDFCVADNGAGFDPDHAAQLFQPFRRLHSQDEFPGIGIGLATVQRIIQRHGGLISATAAPGQGAIFRFNLGSTKAVAAEKAGSQ